MALGLLRLLTVFFAFGFAIYLFWVILRRLQSHNARKNGSSNPYTVLDVSPGVTAEELKAAYHRELAKYHPDKVAHLGLELQRLAQKKTAEIIAAYEKLSR